ncbi:ABC transporter ATP-binding protein [Desulfonatronum thioautotrophicum]|uniref:ABC transporter ATP-binding protein n=1 Tax=Desulfonatronum thioautotrophicum TaxID=617001 RepID=UPI0005EB87BB|nr:ABC transporter ATP-binding protein [Desulfonatronum thioautotrophicum]
MPAIHVQDISKRYEIYAAPQDRLKQSVLPRLQRLARVPAKTYYSEFWALRDIAFSVEQGETVGIIGRNGSGKSTLLQIICGTLTPTGGRVETSGRVAALLELGSGFNPDFTGKENVYLNASILGLTREEIADRYADIVAFADIGDYVDQPVKTYSSGMLVRLSFAVIAHVDADILVVDEALSVGDAFFAQKCMRFLRAFMKTGTVLFVSHDTSAVRGLCTRAIWLDRGRMRLQGSPKDVCERYLEELFESVQGRSVAVPSLGRSARSEGHPDPPDVRQELLDRSTLRNDIRVFAFDPEAKSFGRGGARITAVTLLDARGKVLNWTIGGELTVLRICILAHEDLGSPIVGFYLKDRLGQCIFGDNTHLTYLDAPVACPAGRSLTAEFSFRMPRLPVGHYSIAAAIAEGTQEDHVHHHFIHDAVVFKSETSSVAGGLVGIPMHNITMDLEPENAEY